MKFTVPDGVPPADVTVAVKVTLAPEAAVLEEDTSVVVVAAGVVLDPLPPVLLELLVAVELVFPPPHPESNQAATIVAKMNRTALRWPFIRDS